MGCCQAAHQFEEHPIEDKHVPTKDDYNFTKVLGTGASCQVVAANSKHNNESKYAIKVIKKATGAQATPSELLFRTEVKILSALRHPNIVEYVESFEDNESFYLVTKLCEGGELFDRISEGSFSERIASYLTRQMLLALDHCHSLNISHRDLKPENFVFASRKQDSLIKLIDFGCAVHVADNEIVTDVAGSPYYVAPEVLMSGVKRTGKTWKASDMWSIGVIIFLLVHGYPPFNGEQQEQIFKKIKLGKFRFSRELKLSESVKDLITKLLVMQPEKRLTANEALAHPWIAQVAEVAPDTPIPASVISSLHEFKTKCRLKKAVGRALASRMTDDDKRALEAVFKQFDLNGDGQLGPDEIAKMMKHIGRNEADAKDFLDAVDENKDGTISKEEFQTAHIVGKLSDDQEIKAGFDKFDIDNDGFIDQSEIEKMCAFLTPEAAKQLISETDENGDGKINFKEWLQAMHEIQKAKS